MKIAKKILRWSALPIAAVVLIAFLIDVRDVDLIPEL